ncbi:MAG: hypothetical protein H0T17_07735 [Propionibacteriales bacterium]|nr:hypothetical protein [Propionibacteriales bacterium]
MSLMSLAAAEEQTRDLPVSPIVFGLIAFAMLLALMAGLLMFGKGRPHP